MFWIIIALLGMIGGAGNFSINTGGLFPPFALALARKSSKSFPLLLPQVEQLIRALYKGDISESQFKDVLLETGLSSDFADVLYRSSRQMLNAYDYITLFRRGELEEGELNNLLHNTGLMDDDISRIKRSTMYYPNPADLVRFAVREVYTPSIANKYGLFDDFPQEFIEAASKAGLSEEHAKHFWGAHWELPSPMQGYEMLHRGLIDESGLDELLRVADYMPYWRDKLRDISYNVVTRVDVRRLYKIGIYDRAKVFETYKKMGYNPEDAEALTRFTEEEYSEQDEIIQSTQTLVKGEDGNLTPSRAMVIDAYKRGIYSLEDAIAKLVNLKYTVADANTIIQVADDDLKQDIIDLQADEIANRYVSGDITLEQFKTELTMLGVSSRYLELVVNREIIQAKKRIKLPTKADLDSWIKKDIIDSNYYRSVLSQYGYKDDDIERYYIEALIEGKKIESVDDYYGL